MWCIQREYSLGTRICQYLYGNCLTESFAVGRLPCGTLVGFKGVANGVLRVQTLLVEAVRGAAAAACFACFCWLVSGASATSFPVSCWLTLCAAAAAAACF